MRALVIAALLVAHASPCLAHAIGISRGEYRAVADGVRADLIFARPEMMTALSGLDADRDGTLSADEVTAARGRVSEWLRKGVVIDSPSGPCSGTLDTAAITEQDGLELKALYRCPGQTTGFAVRLDLLADLSLGHRQLATASAAGTSVQAVLYSAEPRIEIAAPPGTLGGQSAAQPAPVAGGGSSVPGRPLFRLGIERLVFGYDHLLFLLAVLLVGGRLRAVATWVAAFTLAHSIALALGSLGVWTPERSLVGPATALTLVTLGVANCLGHGFERRWRIIFLFGLVHGFGLADGLRAVAPSASELPFALASFNFGVETGQLIVLAIALPLLGWLAARTWFARGLHFGSAAISAIGLWWFVVRIGGLWTA